MNRYRSGYYYEKKARDLLYEEGALYVIESRGSHGDFDLVALFDDGVVLVQVKAIGSRKSIKINRKKYDRYRLPFVKDIFLYVFYKHGSLEKLRL